MLAGMDGLMTRLTPNMIEAAATRIAPHIHHTPILRCTSLDRMTGATLLLKAENLQRVGAFKARGAFNALLAMGGAARERGVIAVSSGNHAQAVALAARELGVHAIIVMPDDSNPSKVEATLAYGADVISRGVTNDNREQVCRQVAVDLGLPVVHPYDDLFVMAGQGTVGLELTQTAQAPDVVVVPVGGGGLIAGVATAVKDRWPRTEVIGVEPAGADDARQSLEAGHLVTLSATPSTKVDGVKVLRVGDHPWVVIEDLVDDIVTVTDEQTFDAMELLWLRAKSVVEPAGAMPLAAMLSGQIEAKSAALVLSGGNVDLDSWASWRKARSNF